MLNVNVWLRGEQTIPKLQKSDPGKMHSVVKIGTTCRADAAEVCFHVAAQLVLYLLLRGSGSPSTPDLGSRFSDNYFFSVFQISAEGINMQFNYYNIACGELMNLL